mmetsp:Transcript_25244/g.63515  ORF Transcript_25244/g.63515 Transcript_25244/m.63515 type:complete len:218 (+) Transcript_25244:3954-4607(+)
MAKGTKMEEPALIIRCSRNWTWQNGFVFCAPYVPSFVTSRPTVVPSGPMGCEPMVPLPFGVPFDWRYSMSSGTGRPPSESWHLYAPSSPLSSGATIRTVMRSFLSANSIVPNVSCMYSRLVCVEKGAWFPFVGPMRLRMRATGLQGRTKFLALLDTAIFSRSRCDRYRPPLSFSLVNSAEKCVGKYPHFGTGRAPPRWNVGWEDEVMVMPTGMVSLM